MKIINTRNKTFYPLSPNKGSGRLFDMFWDVLVWHGMVWSFIEFQSFTLTQTGQKVCGGFGVKLI